MPELNQFVVANAYLLDMLFRHQLYLDGLKRGLAAPYAAMLDKLYAQLAALIARYRYTNMNQFTQAEFNRLIQNFQHVQAVAYNEYTAQLLARLKEFINADDRMVQAIFNRVDRQPILVSGEAWKDVSTEPNPANGQLLDAFLASFATSASAKALNSLRQSWVNGITVSEAQDIIGVQLFNRLFAGQSALVGTTFQFASSLVQHEQAGQVSEHYQWVSVLDTHTTLICRSRDGKVYNYGDGPQPPAHYGCRSVTVMLLGDSAIDVSTPSAEFFNVAKPINSVSDFESKLKSILGEKP